MSPRTARAVLLALGIALLAVLAARLRPGGSPVPTGTPPPVADPDAGSGGSGLGAAPGRTGSPPRGAAASPETPAESDAWRPRSIRGRLLFPDGSPASGAWIQLGSVARRPSRMSIARSDWPDARTAEDGSFEIPSLDEAVYFARADVERGDRTWRLRCEVEPGLEEVAWTLEEGRLRLKVRVLDPDGAPVDSASVHLVVGGRAFYAYASGGVAVFHEFPDAPLAGPAGLVAQLFPGEGPALWAATTVSGVDLARGEATVRCARGAVIEGRVAPGTDGRVPAGTVHADAEGGGLRAHIAQREAAVGPDGAFRFEAMAPGPWRLRVLGPLLATLTEDVVAQAGDADVVLSPFATTTVRVRVVDPDGRPVGGATVSSHLLFEEDRSAVTDEEGIALIEGVRPGVPRSLRARTREAAPRSAGLAAWMPADTTLTLARAGLGDADVSGFVKDTTGAPISFVAVWGRQGGRVAKIRADEGGRFRLEGLAPGAVTLEVRLAEGWDQPESMEVGATAVATAPAEDVPVVVDLGATLRVRFVNWPFDVDREGAVLVDEGNGAVVRPVCWPWSGIRFGRLDPHATYTLFAHATATDLFAQVPGIRAGGQVVARLRHGSSLGGRVLGVGPDDETTVVATLHGVDMAAEVARDGRFEVRGLPPDAVVDLLASAAGPGGGRREARGRARAGESGVDLVLGDAPAERR